ncbi:MAG: protein translocase subunit SecD [Nitrospirae bacterium]|nr:protein translocase subunit SecD [Nitrospirota bacterium]
MKKVRARLFALIGLAVISVFLSIPSWPHIANQLPAWMQMMLPEQGVALGLDLQGGIHLVLEVEEERAVEIALDRLVRAVQDLLADKNLAVVEVKREQSRFLQVVALADTDIDAIDSEINEMFSSFDPASKEGNMLTYELQTSEVQRIKTSAMSQALETIRNRIDQFGVAEPLIQRQGRTQIVIQLPGIKDPKRAKALIKDTALLEFKMLDESSEMRLELPREILRTQEAEIVAKFADKVPEGSSILFEHPAVEEGQDAFSLPYLVKKIASLTGDVLQDAGVSYDDFTEPLVSVTFDSKGAKEFDRLTAANVGKRMAIVLDGTVYSAPVINERISGGRAQITGSFNAAEANDLAIVLRAGALPAPMKTLQDLMVGPSLGKDSIEKGLNSMLWAGALVLLFMVVYYRLSGVIANFALMLNLVALLGALSALNATLTLPGIAGIILTIGMGVDSNVLIFERIREELRQGRPVRLAVDSGYAKAFLTIVDSHVTTLITGLALFVFGTGPIKGFAVTLCLGIAINLFTALVGTKVVFDIINRRKLQTLSI